MIMNYSKKGVRAKQKALNSKSSKWGRKFALTCIRVSLMAIIGFVIWVAAAGIGMFKGVIASTPVVNIDQIAPIGEASIIFDREGNEIDKLVGTNSNRNIITDMSLIPQNLANAFVAIEDERFYEHNGIDFKGLVRSAYQYLKTGGKQTQGASTITQQLLKNVIFTDWMSEGDNVVKKVKRKLQEQYLAIEVTKASTRENILLHYMNAINLGQNTLGVEAASQRYFGKSCSDLTLSECAVIASITQNPTGYNPLRNPEKNQLRRETCLNKMLDLNFITKAEYDEAIDDTDDVYTRIGNYNENLQASTEGSYFTDALQKQILEDLIAAGYNETMANNLLFSGGLRIYSTLDPKIQAIADEEAANEAHYPDSVKWYLTYSLTVYDANGNVTNYSKENMKTYFQENINKNFNLIFSSRDEAEEAIEIYKAAVMQEGDTCDDSISLTLQPQVSMTVIDQETGYVVAIIGGRGDKEGRLTYNRGTDAPRQPGSTFKVVAAYAAALDSVGLTLATVYNDAAFNYADGRPVSNWYDSGYRGLTSIRMAIQESMNIIAVKTLTQITPQLGYDYLLNFGFTTLVSSREVKGEIKSDIVQSMALGGLTDGVTNLELCAAYATIANGGTYATPKLYTKVVDKDGNVILDNTKPETRQVIKETTAYLLTLAMVDVVTSGTGGAVKFPGMAIAGKTGTTTKNVDVWFAGYTPYYTCTTWAGYDNNISLSKSTGELNIAKKLWRAVMSRIHEDLPNVPFTVPSEGIIQRTVCSRSGKLPMPGLCDAYCVTEYFALGTEPVDSCSIHYQGPICQYSNLPASEYCPFRVDGIRELPLIEDPSLYSGYPEGTLYNTTNQCIHNEEFLMNPDYEAIIQQQTWEIEMRNIPAETVPETTPE